MLATLIGKGKGIVLIERHLGEGLNHGLCESGELGDGSRSGFLDFLIDRGLETLVDQFVLKLVELSNIGLAPALSLPVPHVKILLDLGEAQGGGGEGEEEQGDDRLV